MTIKINVFVFSFLILLFIGCQEKKVVFIPITTDRVSFVIDSVQKPEVSTFGIKVRIINRLNKKIILFFTPKKNNFKQQYEDMLITNNMETFLIGVRSNNLLFDENTNTSFTVDGYFGFNNNKKIFHDFQYFSNENSFVKGKLIYTYSGKLPKNIDEIIKQESLNRFDTIYIPTRIEGNTDGAKVVESLY